MGKDILIDETGNYLIANGDFVIGESTDQEVAEILTMSSGECKEDPIIGADLITLIKSNASTLDVRRAAKLHLARDGKNYDELKENITIQ